MTNISGGQVCIRIRQITVMEAGVASAAEIISSALNKAAPLMTYLNATTY